MRTFRLALVVALAAGAVAVGSSALAADPVGTVNVSSASGQNIEQVELSPGRVTWIDGHPKYDPLYKEGVQLDGSTITLGIVSNLGLVRPKSNGGCCPDRVFGVGGLTASGARTGWTTETHADYYENGVILADVTPGGRLSTGGTVTQTFKAPSVVDQVSGTRVLYRNSVGYRLFDLRTKVSTDLVAAYGGAAHKLEAAALWGNSLYFARADQSIWRKDLGSTAKTVRLVPGSSSYYSTVLFAYGDYVAWIRQGPSNALDCGIRSNAFGSPVVELPLCTTGLTSAGSIGQDADTKVWSLQRYDGSNTDLPVPTTATQVTIDGNLIAWIQADGVAKIAPFDAPDTAPRYLGNAIAPTTYKRGGPSWGLDLVTSAALAKCSVSFKRVNGATFRTIPCSSGLMPAGEVQVHWDGKNGSGVRVPTGTYQWIVTAADAQFDDLLGTDGLPGQITGSIKVS